MKSSLFQPDTDTPASPDKDQQDMDVHTPGPSWDDSKNKPRKTRKTPPAFKPDKTVPRPSAPGSGWEKSPTKTQRTPPAYKPPKRPKRAAAQDVDDTSKKPRKAKTPPPAAAAAQPDEPDKIKVLIYRHVVHDSMEAVVHPETLDLVGPQSEELLQFLEKTCATVKTLIEMNVFYKFSEAEVLPPAAAAQAAEEEGQQEETEQEGEKEEEGEKDDDKVLTMHFISFGIRCPFLQLSDSS